MAHDVISTCPVCEHELSVTKLQCRECGTTLEGEFAVGRFARLSREQLALLESFLRSRGNLREMERELGISYPTVRGRVESLVRALGLAGEQDAPIDVTDGTAAGTPRANPAGDRIAEERRNVLERVARREIAAEDAAAILRNLSAAAEPTS
ncbi:MAG: DUF2089 domain-containing protein [Candidatus Limnocylindrales bacterium]